MLDPTTLSREAIQIHAYFEGLFYSLVTLFIVVGVLVEYFRLPLNGVPSVGSLVGRALIAAILLHTYPEVSRICADITDGISQRLGDLNQIRFVLNRMGDRLQEFSWSWVSVEKSLVFGLSFLGFFCLHFTVWVAQAFLLYTYTLLYVFSPILAALFVLPQTASATSALYRSLFEASCWKIVWSVLATLLWSTGVSDITQHQNIVSSICFNLILAGSLILTPFVVHALAGRGVSSMAGGLGSLAIGGIATVTPFRVVSTAVSAGKRSYNAAHSTADVVTRKRFPKSNHYVQNLPRFRTAKKPPIFEKPKDEVRS